MRSIFLVVGLLVSPALLFADDVGYRLPEGVTPTSQAIGGRFEQIRTVETAESCVDRRERNADDLRKVMEPYSR